MLHIIFIPYELDMYCAIAVIDQQTCNYVKSLTMLWPAGFADRNLLNFKSFYFPGNIRDLPSW